MTTLGYTLLVEIESRGQIDADFLEVEDLRVGEIRKGKNFIKEQERNTKNSRRCGER